jgi:hypothetical protein
VNNDVALMTNYGPLLGLDIIAFAMRLYYVYKNKQAVEVSPTEGPA